MFSASVEFGNVSSFFKRRPPATLDEVKKAASLFQRERSYTNFKAWDHLYAKLVKIQVPLAMRSKDRNSQIHWMTSWVHMFEYLEDQLAHWFNHLAEKANAEGCGAKEISLLPTLDRKSQKGLAQTIDHGSFLNVEAVRKIQSDFREFDDSERESAYEKWTKGLMLLSCVNVPSASLKNVSAARKSIQFKRIQFQMMGELNTNLEQAKIKLSGSGGWCVKDDAKDESPRGPRLHV